MLSYSETELLVSMMVEDLNRMLQECFSTNYSEQKQTSAGFSEETDSLHERSVIRNENAPTYLTTYERIGILTLSS